LEVAFPIEFVVKGTPVSLKASAASKQAWKDKVTEASKAEIPGDSWASEKSVSISLLYLPAEENVPDVDNILKSILDALSPHILMDDKQVERVMVQRIEADRMYSFSNPTALLTEVVKGERPALYVNMRADGLSEVTV
jgi:crossover junction endodeoxyribonuclease RusA